MKASQADELRHLAFVGAKATCSRVSIRRPVRPTVKHRAIPCVGDEPAEQVGEFIAWLLEQNQIDPSLYRVHPLQRRLSACLRALRVSSTNAARALLLQHPNLLPVALDAILLGVTEFFRDPAVFDAIMSLLPTLNSPGRRLRIWSAACSNGSELYSATILLNKLNMAKKSDLLGTDCRPHAIQQAQEAVYGAIYLRQVQPSIRDRYFHWDGAKFHLIDEIRKSVRWQIQDLSKEQSPGPWDIIFWRNTAIYLRADAAQKIWNPLAESLRPGGILVTGKAEHPNCNTPLTRIGACLYQKKEDRDHVQ